MENTKLNIVVTGQVQGVGFRYYTQRKARQYGIVGFVRNLPDGRVEVEALGPRQELEQLLTDVNRGPVASRVEACQATWREWKQEYDDFSVCY
jgi:acylphosphatase